MLKIELHYPDILNQSKPSFYPNSYFLLYIQVASKKDFNDCTGFEESDEGESGPVTVSFDKVLYNHAYDCDDDPLESTTRWESLTKCGPGPVSFDKVFRHHIYDCDYDDDLLKSANSDL